MKLQATDRTGKVHCGKEVKHFLISAENDTPLLIVKEMIIGDLVNFQIFQPGDAEFAQAARNLGYDIVVSKVS